MIYEHTSYRTFLKAMLAERTAENPSYSLRTLARQLGISPAILSQAINAKRNLSTRMALRVAQNLNLPTEEVNYFCMLAQYEVEKHPDLKAAIHSRLQEVLTPRHGSMPRDLGVEMFKFISEWYHIPIVEMTELQDFVFNPTNVAKKLGIKRVEAEVAIERLERLQLIKKNENGKYRKSNSEYEFHSDQMNHALNTFHRQMLNKAIESLEGQPRNQRGVVSNTFSIDPRLLPKAMKIVAKFRRELVELFNTSDANTETYHMGLQIFRLTNSEGHDV